MLRLGSNLKQDIFCINLNRVEREKVILRYIIRFRKQWKRSGSNKGVARKKLRGANYLSFKSDFIYL